MNIGQAIERLKAGERVARAGWNGKGMWLRYVAADQWRAVFPATAAVTYYLPWIAMKTADDGLVPWLCSQTDLLAEDWAVVQ